ncbi:hypothetical protein AB3S75_018609 [Citrus x aurantiifolia]
MEGGSSGKRRTRSQVGPDWSSKESLILVNEIAAVEADCLKALSSYQKWKIISETCTALDVPRTANQCRRKWDSLLDEYKKIIVRSRTFPNSQTQTHSDCFPPNFDCELFKAIHDFVMSKDNRSDDTDPDSDTDPEADFSEAISQAQLGSKRQRRQSMHVKHCAEQKPLKSCLHENHQKSGYTEEKLCNSHVEEEPWIRLVEKKCQNSRIKEKSLKSCVEENKQMMVAKLQENAELIHAIVAESADYSDADLNNVQDLQSEFVRRQGDKLIACLGEIVNTLNQFTDHVQECK